MTSWRHTVSSAFAWRRLPRWPGSTSWTTWPLTTSLGAIRRCLRCCAVLYVVPPPPVRCTLRPVSPLINPSAVQLLLRVPCQVTKHGKPLEAQEAVSALEEAEPGCIARALELPKKSKERKLAKAVAVFAERYQLLDAQRQLPSQRFARVFKDGR